VIAVDRDPAAPGFRYADRRAIVSLDDEPALERLAEAERVHGVIAPGIDWAVGAAARIAARFGLPHPISPATAVLSSSKLRQRERLAEAGVPQTRWKVVTEPDDELGFPCVVKPTDRQGRRGLALVRTRDQLEDAVREALRASRCGLCLVEELAQGPEVTVTGFSSGGVFQPLTVMDRLPLAHVWPSHGGRSAAAVAEQAVQALGIENGPSSTQLRVGPEGPRVVELGARLGGGHDAELCRAALRVNLNRLAIAAALGEPVPGNRVAPQARVGGACIRFLVAPAGELRAVSGLKAAFETDGVRGIRIYRKPGHVFGPLRSGADRAGAILAVGSSADEALARADRAKSHVRFEVEAARVVA
jgi:biotin carboxylase